MNGLITKWFFFHFKTLHTFFSIFILAFLFGLKNQNFVLQKYCWQHWKYIQKKIIISSYCLNKSLSRNLAYSMDENVNNYSLDFSCKGIRNELYHFLISILIQNFEIQKLYFTSRW